VIAKNIDSAANGTRTKTRLINQIPVPQYLFVRKDIDVNEHDILFNLILRHKLK
jgi:hypothetical protein